MTIDLEKVLGFEFPESTYTYAQDDVILYHLGIGAGVPQTDPGELEYTYEKNLKVLPSFATIPAMDAAPPEDGPPLEVNLSAVHGDHDIELHRPIPSNATVTQRARVTEVWDKKKAAVVVIRIETRDEEGRLLFTNSMAEFRPGEGGFGGESGPGIGNAAPQRDPDGVIEVPTLPQQALIYRLSGDKYAYHVDPEAAALGGFEAPFMHGLCSYGIVCKAIVDGVLGGDVTRVSRYQVRFSGVVFPGETYRIAHWREGARILIDARCVERDAPIISNAAITVS